MSRILVIRGGGVGDFILTLPVLSALRRHFPRHRLEILGYPAVAALAVAGGLAEGVSAIESPRLAGFFADGGSWADKEAVWLSGFEQIVSYLYDPRDIFRANVARCSSAPFVAGPHRPDETVAIHAAEQLLQPLTALGIHGADPRPRLTLPSASPATPCLALHPGSGGERKNWPEARWAELLKLVAAESTRPVLLIGGEAEGDRCTRLAAAMPPGRVEVAQQLPLVELAGKMRSCTAFIGHDSGITHLAAALDLPGLVVWGETNLAVWRPQSGRMNILRDPGGLGTLPVAAVWRELQPFL